MTDNEKQILKNWSGYRFPETHFYSDEKMLAFAKYYAEQQANNKICKCGLTADGALYGVAMCEQCLHKNT